MNLVSVDLCLISLISPPKAWSMTRTLTEANENSIWGKLYQNKMDGLDSFYPFKNGLEHILNKSKVAYLQNGEQIRYFEDYHCKVRTINIHHIYLYILKVS